MNTLKEAWEDYRRKVVPKTAGENQVIETRRAFYAGAAAMFSLFALTREQSVNKAAAAAFLEGLRQECLAFSDDVGKGRG